jgi:hypothetical protein
MARGDGLVSIEKVVARLAEITGRYIAQVTRKAERRMPPITAKTFLGELKNFTKTIESYLAAQSELWIAEHGKTKNRTIYAPAADLADDVVAMGLNFGFDSILGGGDDVAERQAQLLETETKLQSGEYKAGTHALTAIFESFLDDTASRRAGLKFSVREANRGLKRNAEGVAKVDAGAATYMAAILESLTEEVLQEAGDLASRSKKARIIGPEHLPAPLAEQAQSTGLAAEAGEDDSMAWP